MSSLCARNAACVSSAVVQPLPSRIAPYSPTNVFPVFGLIELHRECVPALRQNVVLPGLRLTAAWMLAPGEMLMLPAAQVMLGCVPAPGVAGGGATTPSLRILRFEGGRGAWAARSTTSPVTPPKILATSATAS